MPAISVILPTFNRAATLQRAIDSVLVQSFRDFELIVVDDASTDATPALLGSIGDARLRVLRLPHNRGAAGARNQGIRAASGGWVAFQDSDDVWLPAKLEQQYALAAQAPTEVGLVLGGYTVHTADGHLHIRPAATLGGADPRPDLLDGWPIITPTWLVRRDVLLAVGGFDETYPCLEDWDLVFRLSDACRIRAVPGPLLVKHGSLDSVCADPYRMQRALQRILETHLHRWHGQPQRLARRLAHLGVLQFRTGQRGRARSTLARALRTDFRAPAIHGLLWSSFAGARALRLAERLWPRYAGMAP
ncbi:MAG TPA: glycosyltransferase [Solimonas sp.]|nr:glycosyltransferase [Solimonas sp.]